MPSTPTKLPSGSWRCFAYLGRDGSGKQKRISCTASTKKEASRKAIMMEDEWKGRSASPDSRFTLGEAIDRYIERYSSMFSPMTVSGYRSIRRVAFPGLMDVRLIDLTQAMVQDAVTQELTHKSPKSVRNAHGLLSAVLKEYRPGFVLSTRLPQLVPDEMVIPEKEDIEALVAAADDQGDPALALAIVFASQLGLRRGEICALTFADVSGGQCRISKSMVRKPGTASEMGAFIIKTPKTRSGVRVLPLTAECQRRISELEGEPDEHLIGLSPDAITRRFERLLVSTGSMHMRFHDLRHYNASLMIALQVPEPYIVERLGHRDSTMVRRVYGHIMDKKRQEVSDRISSYFDD